MSKARETHERHDTATQYLRGKEAGPLIGVKEGTLTQWRHKGRGPAYFIPPGTRTVLYDVTELRRFVERGRVETADVYVSRSTQRV